MNMNAVPQTIKPINVLYKDGMVLMSLVALVFTSYETKILLPYVPRKMTLTPTVLLSAFNLSY